MIDWAEEGVEVEGVEVEAVAQAASARARTSTTAVRNAFMGISLVEVLHDSTGRRAPIDSPHDRAR